MTHITGTLTVNKGNFTFAFDQPCTLSNGQVYDVVLKKQVVSPELRALRLHHWQQMMTLAHKRQRQGGELDVMDTLLYNEHMRAVQALNDVFPLGDNAEHDNEAIRASGG